VTIIVQLAGTDRREAADIPVQDSAPVLALCRRLVGAGQIRLKERALSPTLRCTQPRPCFHVQSRQ